jgi:hypothetical protein
MQGPVDPELFFNRDQDRDEKFSSKVYLKFFSQGPVENAGNCKQSRQVGMLIPTFSRQGPTGIPSGPHPIPLKPRVGW